MANVCYTVTHPFDEIPIIAEALLKILLYNFSHWYDRDLESPSTRQKYWIGRLQRFYPDFFLSSILSILLQANALVGCGVTSALNFLFNMASFFLLGA
jgi:hypothetical protein